MFTAPPGGGKTSGRGLGGWGTPLATHKKKIPAKTGIFQKRRDAVSARS
jgi:hypothetical protein